ncbi:hypothetical protein ACA30_04625 [Virgibacillus soli]|nr:hypothetical protein ACA30_04625 [Virgibacillus soli]
MFLNLERANLPLIDSGLFDPEPLPSAAGQRKAEATVQRHTYFYSKAEQLGRAVQAQRCSN